MPLTEKQCQKVVQWLEAKAEGGPKACPVCDVHDWGYGEVIFTQSVVEGKARQDLGTYLVPIVCNNCAYTMLLSAAVMELEY